MCYLQIKKLIKKLIFLILKLIKIYYKYIKYIHNKIYILLQIYILYLETNLIYFHFNEVNKIASTYRTFNIIDFFNAIFTINSAANTT